MSEQFALLAELRPMVAQLVAAMQDLDCDIASRRSSLDAISSTMFEATALPPAEVRAIEVHEIPLGGASIRVRLYRPVGKDAVRPLHVHYHGGGFWFRAATVTDLTCRSIACGTGMVVAAVEYRLTPEHPFPIPFDDSYAALEWLDAHAPDLSVDKARITLSGSSAGANLAAAVTIAARDRNGPAVRGTLLDVPLVDLSLDRPSVNIFGSGFGLTRRDLAQIYQWYGGGAGYSSPATIKDLSGLGPFMIATAECDPLRDGGEQFARRLADASVSVSAQRWLGHIHGSLAMTAVLESARNYQAAAAAFLKSCVADEPYRGIAVTQ